MSNEWLDKYYAERKAAFAKHVAKEGWDWGPEGAWAYSQEKAVRDALAAASPELARALSKNPGAVISPYSPTGKRLEWSKPAWQNVLVLTEDIGGDPFHDRRQYAAFEKAAEILNTRHGATTMGEFEWHWESINPAVQIFYATMQPYRGRENPPRTHQVQRVVAKVEQISPKMGVVGSPADVATALYKYIGDRASEYFVVLFLDVRNNAIGYIEFASGEIAGVSIHPHEIFQAALSVNAAGFVTAHNHPTGDPTPSEEDRNLWRRLRAVGELHGIPLVDNLVIGATRWYSEGASDTGPYAKPRAARAAADKES